VVDGGAIGKQLHRTFEFIEIPPGSNRLQSLIHSLSTPLFFFLIVFQIMVKAKFKHVDLSSQIRNYLICSCSPKLARDHPAQVDMKKVSHGSQYLYDH
jgi:hypothetical protein